MRERMPAGVAKERERVHRSEKNKRKYTCDSVTVIKHKEKLYEQQALILRINITPIEVEMNEGEFGPSYSARRTRRDQLSM